jgi:hypothetical protein
MRRFLIIAFLCLMVPAAAQDNGMTSIQVPAQCTATKVMFEVLSGAYNERPVFVGNAGQAWFMVTANSASGTWSILAYTKETACVFGTGTGFNTAPRGPTI